MPKKELILSILKELTNDDSLANQMPLNSFLQNNPDLNQEAELYKSIWDDTKEYKTSVKFDSSAAFSKFQDRVAQQEKTVKQDKLAVVHKADNQPSPSVSSAEPKVVTLFSRRRMLSFAAIGLLLISATFFFFNAGSNGFVITNTEGLAYHETLPDGSKLTMAPNASINVSSKFAKKNRSTNLLRGQVFYEVAKNKNLPFSVEVGDLNIVVTGTSFNVKWNKTVQIDLVEGSIDVSLKNKEYSLEAGEQLIYNPENQSVTVNKKIDPNSIKWLDNGLSFNSTPINKVISDIESFYGVNIDIKTQVPPNCHFTSPDLSNVSLNDLFVILLSAQGMIFDRFNDKNYALVEISCKD